MAHLQRPSFGDVTHSACTIRQSQFRPALSLSLSHTQLQDIPNVGSLCFLTRLRSPSSYIIVIVRRRRVQQSIATNERTNERTYSELHEEATQCGAIAMVHARQRRQKRLLTHARWRLINHNRAHFSAFVCRTLTPNGASLANVCKTFFAAITFQFIFKKCKRTKI
jgi:hypothetical protein